MKGMVAAVMQVSPLEIPIADYDSIDVRSAVNKNVKARIIVVRPKWSTMKAVFELNVDNDTISESQILELVNTAGAYVGIGSYRPTNNGPYGRFKVTSITRI